MTMPPYQQRVVTEENELAEKLEKLLAFLRTPIFDSLDSAEQVRLKWQASIMQNYVSVLTLRIAAFPAASG